MKNKKIFLLEIIFLIVIFLLVPPLSGAKTKTISGSIISVEGGDGFKGTTIKISLGSNDNLKKDQLGWIVKDGEAIAYIKILSVESNSAIAIVTENTTLKGVTSGLSVNFKVEVPEETKPVVSKKPGSYMPMFRGNPAHTGSWLTKGVPEMTEILWKFMTGSYVRSSPAVVDGMVYFGSHDGFLYAIR